MELWHEWQRHMHGDVPQDVSAAAWSSFLDAGIQLECLVAEGPDAQLLGFATVSFTPFAWTASPIAFLQDLFVSGKSRGKGVGSLLLRGVYDLADQAGARQVLWMVDETDTELQSFYARHAMRTPYLRYMRSPWPW